MGAFLKQAMSLVAGQMSGSNRKASFIVKSGRFIYATTGTTIALLWYASYRNERVSPGTLSFPFPGISTAKRKYSPDRPEKQLPSELPAFNKTAGSNAQHLKGTGSGPTALIGPVSLNAGIAKAQQLSGKYPYKWGGGHAQLGLPSYGMPGGPPGTSGPPPGYDCSGSVCAVLGAMGLITKPMTSGELATWGAAGEGTFVTVYANATHTFMKININGKWKWFGTGSDKQARRGGPAWGNFDPNLKAYAVRHPVGFGAGL